MKDVLEFLKGKKTYILAIVMAVLGTLQGLGVFIAPDWIWPILVALGFGSLRDGVNKIAETVKPK